MSWWDQSYYSSPPWDIDGPQPAIVKLSENGEIKPGRVLDVGCGTGNNSIFLAKKGFSVVGIDLAPSAIRLAKHKVRDHRIEVEFRAGNVFELDQLFSANSFSTVIDSGLFHTLSDNERPIFTQQLLHVLQQDGMYFMLAFSDKEKRRGGPRRISKSEIIQTFSKVFKIHYIRDTRFASKIHEQGAQAYLSSMTKL